MSTIFNYKENSEMDLVSIKNLSYR